MNCPMSTGKTCDVKGCKSEATILLTKNELHLCYKHYEDFIDDKQKILNETKNKTEMKQKWEE